MSRGRSALRELYVSPPILSHEYENGLVLVAEPMPWLESAAFTLLLPAGCIYDAPNRVGLANLTCEMVQRGCGQRDSRRFVEDLENLGADTSSSVSNTHTSFGGAMLADTLPEVLGIFADLVLRPHLPGEQLEEGKMVCVQEIRAIEDELAQRLMSGLRRRHYPAPYGRSAPGELVAIEQATLQDVQASFQNNYVPRGAILGVAGKIEWESLREHVGKIFADWKDRPQTAPPETPASGGYEHLQQASQQTQIGVAFASVPYADPNYFQARGAIGVLSDGMSSRLFTEVRENRGLCYTVYASMGSAHRGHGAVLCYAGTSTERAQETLDVMTAELIRLGQGVEQGELDRLKARLKSSLIMIQESSQARSSGVAAEWHHLNRVRTLAELGEHVDRLSCQSINAYLAEHPPADFTIVTLGEQPLEPPDGVS